MEEVIRVENARKTYGSVAALDDVSLTVQKGEWFAVMGPSGSGKSTLLNLLGCLDAASSGKIILCGRDVTNMSESQLTDFRKEHIGFVFQHFYLIPHLTALENVMIAQYYHSMTDEKEARQVLERVGLGSRVKHLPHQLSGGEQQRLCIARALVNQPNILLADEPTGNLDEESERKVLRLFQELHEAGHTIVTVTHDVSVGKLAQHRIQLEHGKIIGTHLSYVEEEKHVDEILEALWVLREENKLTAKHFSEMPLPCPAPKELFGKMQSTGLVSTNNGSIVLSPGAEVRAKNLIRRHRLAEVLFSKVLGMEDDILLEKEACTFEHVLSKEASESICSFLGHPKHCPHGSPIPEGECCMRKTGNRVQGTGYREDTARKMD